MSFEQKNEIKQPYSSDKSPLLRALSNSEGDVKNRNVFSVTYASSAGHAPVLSSLRYSGNEKKQNYLNKILFFDYETEQQDIAAMSVGSLYQSADGLDSNLDTDRLVI